MMKSGPETRDNESKANMLLLAPTSSTVNPISLQTPHSNLKGALAVRQERRLLAVDVYGESALHLAVRRDDKTMVK